MLRVRQLRSVRSGHEFEPQTPGESSVQAQSRGRGEEQQWYGKPAVRYARATGVSQVFTVGYALSIGGDSRCWGQPVRKSRRPQGRAANTLAMLFVAGKLWVGEGTGKADFCAKKIRAQRPVKVIALY